MAVHVPGWEPQPDVWLLIAGLAAGYWIAIVRLGPRFATPGRPVGHALPGHLLGARRAHDVARVRLAGARRRRAHELQRAHGAAPAVRDGRGAAAPARHAGMARAVGAAAAEPRSSAPCASSSRFLPALIVFNVVLVVTHWPWLVEREPAVGCGALRRCTRCCSCRR